MRAVTAWNATPYVPLDRGELENRPFLCRLAPGKDRITFGWLDNGSPDTSHSFFLRKYGTETWEKVFSGCAREGTVTGLEEETEYECFLKRGADGEPSGIRRFRTDSVPGTVVNYLHPGDPIYRFSGHSLCSPCLLRLPDGTLLSSMDVYEGGKAQNLTLLFRSTDDGKNWHYLTELFPCFWGQMFFRGGRLYMLAVSKEYGDLLIGVSDNGGRDWTSPTVLFRGSSYVGERGVHRAPMPFCEAYGRILTDLQFGTWSTGEMNDAVLSAPADCADYTDPTVWRLTDFFRYREEAARIGNGKPMPSAAGGIEGNVVVAPDGKVYDLLRFRDRECMLLSVDPSEPEKKPEFTRFVPMEVTASKFEVHRDPVSGDYFAICSRAVDEPKTVRNLLSLFRSPDLLRWRCTADLIDEREADPHAVGFQYVSFLIEGDDILFLCRTAHGGASNFHDANYQTFHRFSDFRTDRPVR